MAKQIDAATLAALAAYKGKVTKVAADATNGMTGRDWHRAARDPIVSSIIDDDGADAMQRAREENGYYKS